MEKSTAVPQKTRFGTTHRNRRVSLGYEIDQIMLYADMDIITMSYTIIYNYNT